MRRLLALCLAMIPAAALAGVGNIPNAAVGASLIAKAVQSELYGLNVTSGASAGFVLVFDAKTVPADGAVTPTLCLPLAANTGLDWNFRSAPVQFVNGIVVVFSTTGCYSKTASATAFIAASVQ
jgi:hypothetical protein